MRNKIREIELLAPARNLECGIAAIDHGADAVYIGAPQFGARASATNSLSDLKELVSYAHFYNARVYVTLNVILHDEELPEVEKMIWDLYQMGVDALIVQDMGITRLHLPPIPLHGSTQMDNRDAEKVKFLYNAGFKQVVLARELSLGEIRKIHKECPDTKLEVFVHGALCVSYSGQCYVSQSCFGRSANRGECAQFCRMPFALVDSDDKTIVYDKHLLSMKDMNRLNDLEELMDAGAQSFKIEGRLKDVSYVKNVTAAYRQRIDEILKRRKEYKKASSGHCSFQFTPSVEKSFSRGFTDYFLHGRKDDIFSFNTPKSLGEEMGYLKEQRGPFIIVAGVKPFHNGDGACYMDEEGKLQGFRVNRVEGNKLFPAERLPKIAPKTTIYRNFDQEFERDIAKKSAERKIQVRWTLSEYPDGFTLTAKDEDDNYVTLPFEAAKETARTPQRGNIENTLSKLGNTPYETATGDETEIHLSNEWFIPSSVLAEWRRTVIEKLTEARRINYRQERITWETTHHAFPQTSLTYLGNVMNEQARQFYIGHGVTTVQPAYEKEAVPNAVLMFCKHCLRFSMGWCPKHQKGKSPFREPYYLKGRDGRKFRLEFDCRNCQMKVYAEE